jgi:hypothetical protein
MKLILALATKGFVSSLDEEDYDWTRIFERESDNELDEYDEENSEEDSQIEKDFPESEREIFEEDDIRLIKDYM